jgi:predicted RNase H-like HicB family nuclease
MRFLTDGETIFVLADKKEKILDTLARGQMVFALALGELIEELKGEVKKISQDRKYKIAVNRKAYDVILHPDTEDGGFWVECAALPGCASQGDTVEEALAMIKDAIKGHLEVEAERKKKKAAA